MREYDVVIVLGAALEADGQPSMALKRRARHGMALLNSGTASHILFSGGASVNGVSEAEAMLQIGLGMNLDPERAVLESASDSTWENARNSVAILKDKAWQRAIVVSDDYHLSRARLAFRAAGIPVAVSAPRAFGVPAGERFFNATRESLAWLWYRLRSW